MLTEKQKELLLLLHHWTSQNGTAPSYEEMAKNLGLKSKSGIHRLVAALEERGYVQRLAGRARALQVVRLPQDYDTSAPQAKSLPLSCEVVKIDMWGSITNHKDLSDLRPTGQRISAPNALVGQDAKASDLFAAKIATRTLSCAGLMLNDIIFMHKSSPAPDGRIAIVQIDGGCPILKYIYNHGANIIVASLDDSQRPRKFPSKLIGVHSYIVASTRSYS